MFAQITTSLTRSLHMSKYVRCRKGTTLKKDPLPIEGDQYPPQMTRLPLLRRGILHDGETALRERRFGEHGDRCGDQNFLDWDVPRFRYASTLQITLRFLTTSQTQRKPPTRGGRRLKGCDRWGGGLLRSHEAECRIVVLVPATGHCRFQTWPLGGKASTGRRLTRPPTSQDRARAPVPAAPKTPPLAKPLKRPHTI